MPRRSVSDLSAPKVVHLEPGRLQPPAGLCEAAAAIWRSVVSSEQADRFRVSDAPLLRSYCQASVLANLAADALAAEGTYDATGKVHPALSVFEKTTKVQGTMAMRLRICPSARLDQRGAGRTAAGPAPVDFGSLR